MFQIQLTQSDIPIYKDVLYRLYFDAYSETSRIIQTRVAKTASPWTDYSQFGFTNLKEGLHTYEYDFVMDEASDEYCSLEFYYGLFDGDVQIKNIRLFQITDEDTTSITDTTTHATSLLLNASSNVNVELYPNPVQENFKLAFASGLPSDLQVTLIDTRCNIVWSNLVLSDCWKLPVL